MIYEDYKKLKYKYSNSISAYKAILEQRFKDAVILPITAKNGQPMRFVMCEEIKMLLSEIEQAYRDCEIDAVRFVAEESLASCTIEGAKSTLPDTIKLIEGKVPTNKSEKMIQGNIKAIQSILQNGFEFSERSIFELWKAVANDAIDNESIKGDMYRNGDVVVADRIGNITYMAPKCDAIPDMMKELVEFCHDEDRLDPYIKAAAIHYAFVYIHPFCDGNGRTARLLLQNWLINSGLDKYKGVSISSGVLENKTAYCKALENSENNYNDITFIIIFYLETIRDTLYKGIKDFGLNDHHKSNKITPELKTPNYYAYDIKKSCDDLMSAMNMLEKIRFITDKKNEYKNDNDIIRDITKQLIANDDFKRFFRLLYEPEKTAFKTAPLANTLLLEEKRRSYKSQDNDRINKKIEITANHLVEAAIQEIIFPNRFNSCDKKTINSISRKKKHKKKEYEKRLRELCDHCFEEDYKTGIDYIIRLLLENTSSNSPDYINADCIYSDFYGIYISIFLTKELFAKNDWKLSENYTFDDIASEIWVLLNMRNDDKYEENNEPSIFAIKKVISSHPAMKAFCSGSNSFFKHMNALEGGNIPIHEYYKVYNNRVLKYAVYLCEDDPPYMKMLKVVLYVLLVSREKDIVTQTYTDTIIACYINKLKKCTLKDYNKIINEIIATIREAESNKESPYCLFILLLDIITTAYHSFIRENSSVQESNTFFSSVIKEFINIEKSNLLTEKEKIHLIEKRADKRLSAILICFDQLYNDFYFGRTSIMTREFSERTKLIYLKTNLSNYRSAIIKPRVMSKVLHHAIYIFNEEDAIAFYDHMITFISILSKYDMLENIKSADEYMKKLKRNKDYKQYKIMNETGELDELYKYYYDYLMGIHKDFSEIDYSDNEAKYIKNQPQLAMSEKNIVMLTFNSFIRDIEEHNIECLNSDTYLPKKKEGTKSPDPESYTTIDNKGSYIETPIFTVNEETMISFLHCIFGDSCSINKDEIKSLLDFIRTSGLYDSYKNILDLQKMLNAVKPNANKTNVKLLWDIYSLFNLTLQELQILLKLDWMESKKKTLLYIIQKITAIYMKQDKLSNKFIYAMQNAYICNPNILRLQRFIEGIPHQTMRANIFESLIKCGNLYEEIVLNSALEIIKSLIQKIIKALIVVDEQTLLRYYIDLKQREKKDHDLKHFFHFKITQKSLIESIDDMAKYTKFLGE